MKIITPVTNNPEFIRLQYIIFQKFMPVPFEMIVFNDAKQFPDYTNFNDCTIHAKIVQMCDTLGIQCINLVNDSHKTMGSASHRHLDTMRQITAFMLQHPDVYLQIDSDMFLIDTFPIDKFSQIHCAVCTQSRPGIEYVWPNLFYFDIPKLLFKEKIDWGFAHGSDTGVKMNEWLKSYLKTAPSQIFKIKHLPSCTWSETSLPEQLKTPHLIDFLQNDVRNTKSGEFWCELYDSCILHYRAGCNWDRKGVDVHTVMTKRLGVCLETIVSTL
jgi:hypothetical protein